MLDTINITIVDDEKIQIELLKKYVENWSQEENVKVSIGTFYTGESFEFSWSMDKKYNILL